MMRSKTLLLGLLVALTLLQVGCVESRDEESAPANRVENAELGVALATIPESMVLMSNEDTAIELVPAGDKAGRLTITAGQPDIGGVNLVAAVETHEQEILARDGGTYGGQRELGTQLGTGFYSRGQYLVEGNKEEETVIFLVHPFGDRTLEITYRYPVGDDSKVRIEEDLFSVLGELESLPMDTDDSQ